MSYICPIFWGKCHSDVFFILQLTTELYEILEIVDKSSDHLYYMDPITDFLYPFKIVLI